MKYLIIIAIFLALETNFSAEIFEPGMKYSEIPKNVLNNFDKMGIDDSSLLNSYESAFFNAIFEKYRNDFDFTGKKIAYMGDGYNKKSEIFKMERERYKRNPDSSYCMLHCSLYIFDSDQIIESGGYDAAMLFWSKRYIPPKEIIKRLQKRRNKDG